MSEKVFHTFPWDDGKLYDCDPRYPSSLHSWHRRTWNFVDPEATAFIFCFEGPTTLHTPRGTYSLFPGMYASIPQSGTVYGGRGMAILRHGFRGVFLLGGPVEPEGRLKYIDGCTDSLLLPPVKLGDPCLNHLHFPPAITQTMHTHPTARVGLVYRGRGECVTPDADYALVPGVIFSLDAEGRHKFNTFDDQSLDVIAYHPDSDYGPTDEDHPMLNRTIVEGVSAKYLPDIQTS